MIFNGKLGNAGNMRKSVYDTEGRRLDIYNYVDERTKGVAGWPGVVNAVRLGHGPALFPVGYEFTTPDSDTGNDIVWRVVGHDHHKAADPKLEHTMTLEMKYAYSTASGTYKSMQFDAPEALYYAEDGLPAGTYNFTLMAGYDLDYGGGKTFTFTLSKSIPAGGQIMFPWAYQKQSDTTLISTYASNDSTVAIESGIPVTEGADGTYLGTADGKSTNMNHVHRIRYGSNNYAQSVVRQWLNSAAPAGEVWKPMTKFDRPPSWAATYNGLIHGLPAEFLDAVQSAVIPCRTSSTFEVNSLDGTEFTIDQVYDLEDKFFLLSSPEIFGTWDSASYKDGELLEYYDGLTDTERIKRDVSGTARTAWLRSPYPWDANGQRTVNASGAMGYGSASGGYAVLAACIIA